MENQISANTVILWLVLASLVVATFVGNLFVITAILVDKNLQTNANQLVLSLAVADLMVACLVMPLGAYNEVYQGWYLGTQVCEFWTSADVLCCTASILNLLAIALDRYWAVTSVDYIYRRTRERIIVMVICVWTFGAVVSLAPIFGWKDPKFAERVLVEHKCLVSQDIGYQIFATISTFYAPLVLLLALYWRIFQVARKRIHRKPGDRLRGGQQAGPRLPLPAMEANRKRSSAISGPTASIGGSMARAPQGTVGSLREAAKQPEGSHSALLACQQLMNKELIEASSRPDVTRTGAGSTTRPSRGPPSLPGSPSSAPTIAQTTSQLSPSALLLWSCASMDETGVVSGDGGGNCKLGPASLGNVHVDRGCCMESLEEDSGSRQSCCNITCRKLCTQCCCTNCYLIKGLTCSQSASLEATLDHNNNSSLPPADRRPFYADILKTSGTAHRLLDKKWPLERSSGCNLSSASSTTSPRSSVSEAGAPEHGLSCGGAPFCGRTPGDKLVGQDEEERSLSGDFPPPKPAKLATNQTQVELACQEMQTAGEQVGPKRSLDFRRKFKAFGQLISFVQTSRNYFCSSTSGDEDPSPTRNKSERGSMSSTGQRSPGVATLTGGVTALTSLQVAFDEAPLQEHHSRTVVDFSRRPSNARECSRMDTQAASHQQSQVVCLAGLGEQLSSEQVAPLHQPATSATSHQISSAASSLPQARSGIIEAKSARPLHRAPTSGQQRPPQTGAAQHQQRTNIEVKREKKAAKTLAIITGVFVCCWLPFFLNAIIMPICGASCTPSDLVLSILLWLGYLNSMLNPIIYTIFSPDFRRAFRRLLCWAKTSSSS